MCCAVLWQVAEREEDNAMLLYIPLRAEEIEVRPCARACVRGRVRVRALRCARTQTATHMALTW